jgi:NAD(P)H-hydrate epimerase
MMADFIPYHLKELDEDQVRIKSMKTAAKHLKTFDKFAHKGTRGHAAIIAGSNGMMGAALLSTMAAAKSGAGKITALVPVNYFSLVHMAVPEALVKENQPLQTDLHQFDSIGIGPGMGINLVTAEWLRAIGKTQKPCVIDADALNQIAQSKELMDHLPHDAILTPHQLEWERLFGVAENDRDRIEKSMEICSRFKINMILKGHFSCLVTQKQALFINGTGNAGMAKGGSGDVLTGLLTGLLAQGYGAIEAGIIGMYLHGRAGDLSRDKFGEESMTASDIIISFSGAFRDLHKNASSA